MSIGDLIVGFIIGMVTALLLPDIIIVGTIIIVFIIYYINQSKTGVTPKDSGVKEK